MLKKILAGLILAGVAGILIYGAVQRTSIRTGAEGGRAGAGGARWGDNTALVGRGGGRPGWAAGGEAGPAAERPLAQDGVYDVQPGTLDETEIAGLLYMREEEKLARDVYLALYEIWGQPVFQNIAASEQTHMDAVLEAITRYGLADPAAGKTAGQFTNPGLQALYEQLIAQGSRSLADALKAGAAIEEIDILDLEERAAQTDNSGIQTIYMSLIRGSKNHLRAFTRTLAQQTGEVYLPQYMDQTAYQAIVSAVNGNGRRGGRRP